MELKQGDCLELLKGLKAESVDSVCTDPPYGIAFMGKDWDRAIPSVAIWKECLRVLKPGAFAFIMSLPRMDVQSQMVVRLQEAGFRVDFSPLYHCFASGFPKAMNISKAVDKKLGAETIVGITKPKNSMGRLQESYVENGTRKYEAGLSETLNVERYGGIPIREATSPEAKALAGSYAGFQVKPAVEIILVAMRPLSEPTYTEQAMKNGKGVTWLDDARIPYGSNDDFEATVEKSKSFLGTDPKSGIWNGAGFKGNNNSVERIDRLTTKGRFPANLLVSDDALNDGRITKSPESYIRNADGFNDTVYGEKMGEKAGKYSLNYGDSGSFSRYFSLDQWWDKKLSSTELPEAVRKTFPFLICPKASKSERNRGLDGFEDVRTGVTEFAREGFGEKDGHKHLPVISRNAHPTVKPLKLLSYLITLGSRPGDVVLDPFMGSGTTGIACKMLGREFVGMEIDEEYFKIAQARINSDLQISLNTKANPKP